MSLKQCSFFAFSLVSCISFCALLFCAKIENPFSNPENVTIDLIVPDTSNQTVYTLDSIALTMVTSLSSLIDSVTLAVNGKHYSIFTSIQDTMPVTVVFDDSGNIAVKATAYCEKGVTRECEKKVIVHKNPLVAPDTVYTLPLSDTSIKLYWKKVRVAKKYRIYRGLSETGTFSMITAVEDTIYLDTALTDSTVYYYRLSSIDSLSRESDQSPVFSATTFGVPVSKWDQMVWDRDPWE